VEKAALKGDPMKYSKLMSVPLLQKVNCDFSYSGADIHNRLHLTCS
jgi:hypothetical protein